MYNFIYFAQILTMKYTKILLWVIALLSISTMCMEGRAERGVASYYHDRFHGRKMANGRPYNKDSFTCAHRRYPLGTWLRVVNPKNNRAVVVEVTDRGPYSNVFTIDLSRAAARHLDIIFQGHAPVEITKVASQIGGIVPYPLEDEEPEELIDIKLDYVPEAKKYEFPDFPDWDNDTIGS